jgi:uncharacterized protein (DUF1800 family)
MGNRPLFATVALAGLAALSGISANPFTIKIPKEQQVQHALNRLTWGPRPDDAEQVRKMGLKKWVDRQLHPERIPENPVLEKKLAALDTLRMTSAQLVENYPPPQVVRQIAQGRVPYPSDPDKRLMIQRLVARYQRQQGGAGTQAAPPRLNDILSPEEVRTLRAGDAGQRAAFIESLPSSRQDELVGAMPAAMRLGLLPVASPELRRRIEMTSGPQQVVAQDLAQAKFYRAIYSNRQLEDVLTDFWYNHFNVFLDKGADRYLVTGYERDAIRPHVLGRFRDLLEATAKSPAMLFYLDNWQSVGPASRAAGRRAMINAAARRRGLNENYGRELLELHTLGVDGGYTQKDVTEVARCFTGWTIESPQRGGGFVFNSRIHDDGEKIVLGVTIPAGGGIEDGTRVLEILARHPSTARFISRKLAQRFVADNPPPALVERMAGTFHKTDGDIRAVLRTMFQSKEFWSAGAYRSKMKSPFEMVVSAVRAAAGDVDYAQGLASQVAQMGQPLYRKLEPTGYSNSSQEWMNSAGLLARMNFAVQLADNRVPGVKVDAVSRPASGDALPASPFGSPEFQKR